MHQRTASGRSPPSRTTPRASSASPLDPPKRLGIEKFVEGRRKHRHHDDLVEKSIESLLTEFVPHSRESVGAAAAGIVVLQRQRAFGTLSLCARFDAEAAQEIQD